MVVSVDVGVVVTVVVAVEVAVVLKSQSFNSPEMRVEIKEFISPT